MIVRAVSALDPEAAENARTTGFIRRCFACVRAKGGPFQAPPVMTSSHARVFLSGSRSDPT